MEHDFYEEEKPGASRKAKRLGNKRERLQVKNYLKQGRSPNDFIDDEIEDDIDDEAYYKH